MKRFIVEDTVNCNITFTYIVEADSEEEAKIKYQDGDWLEEVGQFRNEWDFDQVSLVVEEEKVNDVTD